MGTLSEHDSKAFLGRYGIAFPDEIVVSDPPGAVRAAETLGGPVALKLVGARLAHKSDRGLVRLRLRDSSAVARAAEELLGAARPEDGKVELLVAAFLEGRRELIAGVLQDPQFGPAVMVGIGGVLAEAVADVAFRLVPLDERDAAEMIGDLRSRALLGPIRGEPAVDRDSLGAILLALSRAAAAEPSLVSADINPLIVVDGRAVPADALVELS